MKTIMNELSAESAQGVIKINRWVLSISNQKVKKKKKKKKNESYWTGIEVTRTASAKFNLYEINQGNSSKYFAL